MSADKQLATSAFQLYGLEGSPPAPHVEDYAEEVYLDLHAVAAVLSILKDEGKDLVAEAVRYVYVAPFPKAASRKRVVDDRVINFAMTRYISVRSVYRYLSDARRLFAAVRYPH